MYASPFLTIELNSSRVVGNYAVGLKLCDNISWWTVSVGKMELDNEERNRMAMRGVNVESETRHLLTPFSPLLKILDAWLGILHLRTTTHPAIMSCNACRFGVKAAIHQPIVRIKVDTHLPNQRPVAWPKLTRLPAMSVTLMPSVNFPSVPCSAELSIAAK